MGMKDKAGKDVVEYFIEYMGKFFKTKDKALADSLKQNNPRVRVSKTPPKGVSPTNIKPAPKTLRQPQNADTGKFQRPAPVPAKPKAPAKAPAKPNAPKATSPSKPKADAKPPAPKAPSATTSVAKPSNPRLDRKAPPKKKPPLAPKGKERINPGPPKKTARPAILRELSRDDAPTIETMPPTSGEGRGPTTRPKVGPKKKTTSTGPTTRPNNRPSSAPKTSPRPKARPAATKAPAKTIDDPLKNWSDPRRKALASSKVGQDAGDGMKWVVGSNSNALVRTRDESKVKEQLRLQGLLKK